MNFHYDFGTAIAGLFIAIAGGAITMFYRWISEHLANGPSSYNKIKRAGLILVIIGLLMISNLHVFLLTWIASFFLPS